MKNRTTVERKSIVSSSSRELSRPGAPRVRGVDQARAVQAVVGAEVVGNVPAFLRNGCSCRGQVSLEFAHRGLKGGVLRHVKEVTPHTRLVWTNEESEEGSVTTVTFAEKDGKTLLVMHELYPSKEALDAAGTGAADAMGETLSSWTSFSSPWARAWDGQMSSIRVGCLALHYSEANPDEDFEIIGAPGEIRTPGLLVVR